MSDFQSLMSEGESTDYGAGEPVPEDEVATIQENLTDVMGDNTLNAQGDNLASENVDEPIPPHPPVEPVGQDGRWQHPLTNTWIIPPTHLSHLWKPIPKISEMFPL